MKPYLQDSDCSLYLGDVREVLRELPPESVDCCVTSPPYLGLRDYGTGSWEGGDPDCDHTKVPGGTGGDPKYGANKGCAGGAPTPMGNACIYCGATRIDHQIGLEDTPEQYVESMVDVFREVHRVLASHGTVFLNLGDSYASQPAGNKTPSGFSQTRPSRRKHGVGDETVDIPARTFGGDIKQKDLVGIPWMVAFALRADGWYLRSDIIWSKPNPMPESITDRPTKSHEYIFMLSKQSKYFFDQEAVREPYTPDNRTKTVHDHDVSGAHDNYASINGAERWAHAGRNIRSVWHIATQPYPEAHFATFPQELARRAILAGCPEQVCQVCGKARERITEVVDTKEQRPSWVGEGNAHGVRGGNHKGRTGNWGTVKDDLGWTDCNCPSHSKSKYRSGIVLDPFGGSGTTAFVARKLARHSVLIELNIEYCELAARRLSQQSLFSDLPSGVPQTPLDVRADARHESEVGDSPNDHPMDRGFDGGEQGLLELDHEPVPTHAAQTVSSPRDDSSDES